MNDEYIYQYPAPEYMENFKEMVAQRTMAHERKLSCALALAWLF